MTPGTFGAAGLKVFGLYSPEKPGCYLIHFDGLVRGARHYIGWAPNIAERFRKHVAGEGSEMTKAAVKNGVAFKVVRVWIGADLEFEKELKLRKEGPRLCFECSIPRKRGPRKR